jgi:lipopolysaccharide/colanic/teichoic acid biosynthesis glycosyltransferase
MSKRLFDILAALILGLLFLPLSGIIGCLLWLESRSPVIYPSLRVGRHGQSFYYLRFRTKTGQPLRKTRLGKFIGNLSLDELPVLWNILKGEMSFIGPRPEIPEKVDLNDPDWQTILSVRPGLTGPGLLTYLDTYNDTPVQERIQPDLYYALNRSLLFDIRLMLKTLYYWIKMGHLKGRV